MSKFKVRVLRAALVVPLLMGSALVASAGHASASINPDNVDRPKISAGDRDFGNKDIFGILSGGIVNWDETDSGTRSMCPKFTPWVITSFMAWLPASATKMLPLASTATPVG